MAEYRYLTGRRTVQGVEICQYYMQGRQAKETIVVVGHGGCEVYAQVMCNYLNQIVATGAEPVTTATSLKGGY